MESKEQKQIIFEENDIAYQLLDKDTKKTAVDLICKIFYEHEPTSQMSKCKYEEYSSFMAACHEDCDNGLSVVAIDTKTNEVVGAFSAMDASDPNNEMDEEETYFCQWYVPEMIMMQELTKPIYKEFKLQYGKTMGVVANFMCLAVKPEFGRRGIAKNLTKALVGNVVSKGFKASFAECTGLYSAKAMCKAGFTVEHTIDYETYKYDMYDEQGELKTMQPFKGKVIEPHTKMSLVVLRHKENE